MRRVGAVLVLFVCLAGVARAQQEPGMGMGTGTGTGTGTEQDTVDPKILIEAPAVSAATSSQQVVLGQVFYLFVRVVHQPGMQVNLPATLPLGPAFEETARTDELRENPDGTMTREFEIALQAFELGELIIPPLPVTYAAQGRAQEVVTQAVPMVVTSAIGEGEAELRDIAGPVAVERADWTLLYVAAAVGGAVLALVLALLARRAWRRRRRRVLARLPEALHRSAHEEALARLDEVEASGALDDEDRKPAYLAMSEILRAYIGRRFGFPALDLTTDEIRRELLARAEAAGAAELVCGWLERSDLVKFAGYDASPEEARSALYDARIFIDRTRAGAVAAATSAPAAGDAGAGAATGGPAAEAGG